MEKNNDIYVAIEILSMMLSRNIFNKKELNQILKEEQLVLSGDKETIEKVINVYGKQVKESVNSARR